MAARLSVHRSRSCACMGALGVRQPGAPVCTSRLHLSCRGSPATGGLPFPGKPQALVRAGLRRTRRWALGRRCTCWIRATRKLKAMALRRAAVTADQVASGHQHRCAKLPVMAVIAVAEMFGISGRRAELARVFGPLTPPRDAARSVCRRGGAEPGCRRYIFAATLTDPSRFVLVSEWKPRRRGRPLSL